MTPEGHIHDPATSMTHVIYGLNGSIYVNATTGEIVDTRHASYYRSQYKDGQWRLITHGARWPILKLPEILPRP